MWQQQNKNKGEKLRIYCCPYFRYETGYYLKVDSG